MAKVFITSEFFGKFSDQGISVLKEAGLEILDPYGHKFLSPEDIVKYSAEADAFICDLEQINQFVIDQSPNLKFVSRRGVGVDSVDVAYAKEKGIEVLRTLGVVEAPVAELVLAYILEFSRRVSKLNADMHQGCWLKSECHSVDGMSLGFVGMGKIAFEVAHRAKAFGMNIIYYDMMENKQAQAEFGAKKVSFEEVLQTADFITIHTPLTEQTAGLFDYDVLCKMKKSAYLINTARGGIVEEAALYRAIKEEKIAGAAIDVFDVEPKEDSMLNELENVILTPHVGTFTREIFIKMDVIAAENIVEALGGK